VTTHLQADALGQDYQPTRCAGFLAAAPLAATKVAEALPVSRKIWYTL